MPKFTYIRVEAKQAGGDSVAAGRARRDRIKELVTEAVRLLQASGRTTIDVKDLLCSTLFEDFSAATREGFQPATPESSAGDLAASADVEGERPVGDGLICEPWTT